MLIVKILINKVLGAVTLLQYYIYFLCVGMIDFKSTFFYK